MPDDKVYREGAHRGDVARGDAREGAFPLFSRARAEWERGGGETRGTGFARCSPAAPWRAESYARATGSLKTPWRCPRKKGAHELAWPSEKEKERRLCAPARSRGKRVALTAFQGWCIRAPGDKGLTWVTRMFGFGVLRCRRRGLHMGIEIRFDRFLHELYY